MKLYRKFLAGKRLSDPITGLSDIADLPTYLFPHQADITRWALRRGRAAIFAGTGLGKTLMELTWAARVAEHTGKPVLIFAPLAVSAQHVREAEHFGLSARIVREQSDIREGVGITNYAKMDRFDIERFGGIVLDESSILKSHDGKTRARLIAECQAVPFRLAATATPSPNDFMELGNHAEFLGVMSFTEMLSMFFVHDGGETQKWRLKGHAESEFWRWMSSWAVMLRKPSDLGYPDDGYDLPPLFTRQHIVAVKYAPNLDAGTLFPIAARTMQERIGARRSSIDERVKLCYELLNEDERAEPRIQSALSREASRQATSESPRVVRTEQGFDRQEPSSRLHESVSSGQSRQVVANASATANDKRQKALEIRDGLGIQNRSQSESQGVASGQSSEAEGPEAEGLWNHDRADERNHGNAEPCVRNLRLCGHVGGEDVSGDRSLSRDREAEGHSLWSVQQGHRTNEGQSDSIGERGSVSPKKWIIWVALNSEQDALERLLGDRCISIRGSHSDDEKERLEKAWREGTTPIMLTKCSMFGHGLNWQCCSQMIFCGLNDSFEQVFQAVRRCWRFGQTKPVNAHFIASELEGAVVANLRRKEADAEKMAEEMVAHMADLSSADLRGMQRSKANYRPRQFPLPKFMGEAS